MVSKKEWKQIKEEMDRLSSRLINLEDSRLINLEDKCSGLNYRFVNYQNDTSNKDKSTTNKLSGLDKVIGYLVTENKTFKTDLIKNYINAQRQRKNYMAEHKQDSGDKILDDPYYAKLTGRIITIGEIYEFLYNKPISDGIVDQYVDASNED